MGPVVSFRLVHGRTSAVGVDDVHSLTPQSPGQTRRVDDDERRRRMCTGKTRHKDQAAAELAARRSEWADDGSGAPLPSSAHSLRRAASSAAA